MFRPNFIYELKQLLRSKWLLLLSVILVLLFGFATYNGLNKVEDRKTIIALAQTETQGNDTKMLKILDSLEQGQQVSLSPWELPSDPVVVGSNYPRIAAMPAADFAFLATGQSDLFTHYKKPKVYGGSIIEDFTEMTSPVQLLFGSFDLAFVVVFLLPLLIVAFSYNVLSAEKESGTLRLLAAQPISIRSWVLQKLLIRFFWLSVLVILSLTLVLLVFGANPFANLLNLLSLFGLVISYMLFWFALAFIVNLWVGSSAKNAVALLGLWIGFVLLVPSILNQLGTTIYPMPSRTLMINELREKQGDATKRQDEILDNYLRDHPEYAVNDTTETRSFWHGYMASQNLLRDEVKPVMDRYNNQLKKQQSWINRFKWLSPAITIQESMNKLAGTATSDYENYREQVLSFSQEWRAHFMPFLYNNREFTKADYTELPSFKYKVSKTTSVGALMIVLGLSVLVYLLGVLVYRKKTTNTILTT